MPVLQIEDHPLLRVACFVSSFPAALGDLHSPDWLVALLRTDAEAPFRPDDALRTAVRDMLRLRGYKPTGRGKPASEYLVRAAADGLHSINAAVDACNVVSLHSGLPISVVDLDIAREPLRIATAVQGERYVFNASGQEIDVGGLLCIHDADGACANAVKDAQRTKTSAATLRTLSVIWGCTGHEPRLADAARWYRTLLGKLDVKTEDVVTIGA